MKSKTFDCVEMNARRRRGIHEATKDLTLEQTIEYWRRRSEEFRRDQERLSRPSRP